MSNDQTIYYKAIRPDGGSFNDPSFKWNTKPGGITQHPNGVVDHHDARNYLSISTTPTDCTGMLIPCNLLAVEPVGHLWTPNAGALPNKRAGLAFRTIEPLDPALALGPQGGQVLDLIERGRNLTAKEVSDLEAAWYAASPAVAEAAARYAAMAVDWDAAWFAAWDTARAAAETGAQTAAEAAARDAASRATRKAATTAVWYAASPAAAREATRSAAMAAARVAAEALVVRDLASDAGHFTLAQYDLLTKPWRQVIGPIHPDDLKVP